jgi:hypothetical protein
MNINRRHIRVAAFSSAERIPAAARTISRERLRRRVFGRSPPQF